MCLGTQDIPEPKETQPRRGYVQPAPKASHSTDAHDRVQRLAAMGVVNPGGAQGVLEPASTTKNLVLGGGATGLNLSGGGGGGGGPAAPAPNTNRAAPVETGAATPAAQMPPKRGGKAGGSIVAAAVRSVAAKNPAGATAALIDRMAKRA